MAVVLLIRHGNTDMVERRVIAGRMPGVHLNENGRLQAQQLAERLLPLPFRLICSSPLERAVQTATPLADSLHMDVRICSGLNEVDFGEWTGREMRSLVGDPKWRQFNLFRTGTRIPGGELLLEVQERVVKELESLSSQYHDEVVAVFSHGDVIKAAIAHYAGIPLDFILRIEISPASVSVVTINDHGPRLLCLNNTGALPDAWARV